MKKFLYTILAAAAVAFSASSCTEDGFLKEEMVATITQQYYETETGLDALVTGMYDHLRYFWMRDTHSTPMWENLNDTGSFNQFLASTYSQTGGGNGYIDSFACYYQNNPYYQRWGAYACYNDALNIIYMIDNKAAEIGGNYSDEAYCNQQKSIAYFAKDWMLYVLYTIMGDVYIPQERTVKDTGIYYAPRSTAETLYDMFIDDMEFAFKWLPKSSSYSGAERNEHINKGTAAMMLAHFHLERALGFKHKALRNADGTYKQGAGDALGMLYKGGESEANELQQAIYWANVVLGEQTHEGISLAGEYSLEPDYVAFSENIKGDFSDEASNEIIWAMPASEMFAGEKNNNGAWGWRTEFYYGRYTSSYWGLPSVVYRYGSHKGKTGSNDWSYTVFTDKFNDSRYDKTFYLDLYPYRVTGSSDSNYESYLTSSNGAAKWLENVNPYDLEGNKNKYVDWFNANKATYFGPNSPYASRVTAVTSGADYATSSDFKISGGDVSLVMIANDREHAIDADLCHSMPFIVAPLWCYYENPADGTRTYYRNKFSYQIMTGSPNHGTTGATSSGRPYIKKFIDPDRPTSNSESAGRNVTVFRLADAYLIRAWAKGLSGDYNGAIGDINTIRQRAGYNTGETRPMAIAQFAEYYGDNNLTATEKQYPYTVENSTKEAMKITADYWTPGTPEFEREQYPHYLTASYNDRNGDALSVYDMNGGFTDATQFYFSNFMINEYCREFLGETVMFFIQQQAGLRYPRLMWHSYRSSTIDVDENGDSIWEEAAANQQANNYFTGTSLGYLKPHMIWQPIAIGYMDKLTNESGQPLTTAERNAYQNPGYVD